MRHARCIGPVSYVFETQDLSKYLVFNQQIIFTWAQRFKMRLSTGGSEHAFFPMRVLSGSHGDFPYTTNTNPIEHKY